MGTATSLYPPLPLAYDTLMADKRLWEMRFEGMKHAMRLAQGTCSCEKFPGEGGRGKGEGGTATHSVTLCR